MDVFKNYKIAKKDIEAIEEGITTVYKKELKFIFAKQELLDKTSVISFDSQFIYLWSKQKFPKLEQETSTLPNYRLFKILHQVPITDGDYSTWYASIIKKEFYKLLPNFFTLKSQLIHPRIAGGPLTPFIKIHQKMRREKEYPLDPYTTRESYLATIVHEFAHAYFDQQCLSWYGIKSYNAKLIQAALNLYKENKKAYNVRVKLPASSQISELFAFCAEYSVARAIWPSHQINIDHFEISRMRRILEEEAKRNLNWEASTIDENAHAFAAILGRIIIDKYPFNWPRYIYKNT